MFLTFEPNPKAMTAMIQLCSHFSGVSEGPEPLQLCALFSSSRMFSLCMLLFFSISKSRKKKKKEKTKPSLLQELQYMAVNQVKIWTCIYTRPKNHLVQGKILGKCVTGGGKKWLIN